MEDGAIPIPPVHRRNVCVMLYILIERCAVFLFLLARLCPSMHRSVVKHTVAVVLLVVGVVELSICSPHALTDDCSDECGGD